MGFASLSLLNGDVSIFGFRARVQVSVGGVSGRDLPGIEY